MDFADYDFRIWLEAALVAGLVLASWRWGRGPERTLALVLAWFMVADPVNHALFSKPAELSSLDAGHVVIDGVAFVVAIFVALYANRMYTLWFAAFQSMAMLAHLARELTRGVAPLAYAMMYIGPFFFQIIVLMLGLWFHHRRERRFGPYRSWRSFSRPSRALTRSRWPNG